MGRFQRRFYSVFSTSTIQHILRNSLFEMCQLQSCNKALQGSCSIWKKMWIFSSQILTIVEQYEFWYFYKYFWTGIAYWDCIPLLEVFLRMFWLYWRIFSLSQTWIVLLPKFVCTEYWKGPVSNPNCFIILLCDPKSERC